MRKIYVVGIGPGNYEDMTARAQQALAGCDVIVGYTVYIDLVKTHFPDKKFMTTPMRKEVERTDVDESHRSACQKKLDVLLEQREDLSSAIDQLIKDIENGDRYMKVYKQMKMYNDPNLNPILYGRK